MQTQFDGFVQLLNIPAVCVVAFLLLIGWAVIGATLQEKMREISMVLAIISLIAILFITVFSRNKTEGHFYYLIPFSTFQRAKEFSILYRYMLLNMIMFLPLGLSLPFIFRGGAWKRILLTILIGLLLSCVIEFIQYVFHLGFADVDDIIANTLGATIGSLSYLLSRLLMKMTKKENSK